MKYSKQIADKIIELYVTGDHSVQAICDAVNISRETFYTWKKSKSFAKRITDAHKKRMDAIGEMALSGMVLLLSKHEYEEKTTEYTEDKSGKPKIKSQKIVKKFIMPNPSMVALALTNRMPDDWKNKTQVEHSGSLKLGKELADETYE